MNHRQSRQANVKYMLAGGSVIAALGLLADPQGLFPHPTSTKDVCQEVVQAKATLSKEQLGKLMTTVSVRANKSQVRQIVKEPYCKLSNLHVRVGTPLQREAYRLSFDSQAWLVVQYEGNEYAGYGFSLHH